MVITKMINMKFGKILIFSLAVMLASCQGKKTVKISGTIGNGKDVMVYLEKHDVATSTMIDSTSLGSSGKFHFKVKVDDPGFYLLKISGKSPITLLLEPGERVEFKADASTFDKSYLVEGSAGSSQVKDIYDRLITLKTKIDSLTKLAKVEVTNQPALLRIYSTTDSLIQAHKEYSIAFMFKNNTSLSMVFALYQQISDGNFLFSSIDDLTYYRMVASVLKSFYPNLTITKVVFNDFDQLDSKVKRYKVNQIVASAVSTLPEIALPNMAGDTVRLSSLQGKVIILDFWSSNYSGALLDNRELLNIYNEFKGKVVVYQVSLDVDKNALTSAIKEGGIPWTVVSDFRGDGCIAAHVYNIQQIPANYIISKKFEIVGKNLFGNDLRKKLKEVLG